MKVCQGPHAQNVQNIDATTLQSLVESIRVMIAPSMPMMPLPELEGEKAPGDKGF